MAYSFQLAKTSVRHKDYYLQKIKFKKNLKLQLIEIENDHLLEIELENFQAIYNRFIQQASDSANILSEMTICIILLNKIIIKKGLYKNFIELVSTFTKLNNFSKFDAEIRAQILYLKGTALRKYGHLTKSLKVLSEVKNISEINNLVGFNLKSNVKLAIINMAADKVDEGVKHIDIAQKICRSKAIHEEESEVLWLKGIFAKHSGKLNKSINYYEQAIELYEKSKNKSNLISALINLAISLRLNNNIMAANNTFIKVTKISNKLGDIRMQGLVFLHKGTFNYNLGKLNLAHEQYSQSLNIFKRIGDRRGETLAITVIGLIFFENGDLDKSMKNFLKSLNINNKIEDEISKSSLFGYLGMLEAIKGNLIKSKEYLENSKTINDKMNIPLFNIVGKINWCLYHFAQYNYLFNLNEKKKANTHKLKMVKNITDSVLSAKNTVTILFDDNFRSPLRILYKILFGTSILNQQISTQMIIDDLFKKFGTNTEYQLVKKACKSKNNEVIELCRYIDNNPFDKLEIYNYLKEKGLSSTSISKRFKKLFGISPKQYQQNKKIKKAKQKLSETNSSIAKIAFQCGFVDSPQFCRLFKKQCGMTPLEYKNQISD